MEESEVTNAGEAVGQASQCEASAAGEGAVSDASEACRQGDRDERCAAIKGVVWDCSGAFWHCRVPLRVDGEETRHHLVLLLLRHPSQCRLRCLHHTCGVAQLGLQVRIDALVGAALRLRYRLVRLHPSYERRDRVASRVHGHDHQLLDRTATNTALEATFGLHCSDRTQLAIDCVPAWLVAHGPRATHATDAALLVVAHHHAQMCPNEMKFGGVIPE